MAYRFRILLRPVTPKKLRLISPNISAQIKSDTVKWAENAVKWTKKYPKETESYFGYMMEMKSRREGKLIKVGVEPYRRTGNLGRSWFITKTDTTKTFQVSINNSAIDKARRTRKWYAGWVHGPFGTSEIEQQEQHKVTGWRQINEGLDIEILVA